MSNDWAVPTAPQISGILGNHIIFFIKAAGISLADGGKPDDGRPAARHHPESAIPLTFFAPRLR